MALLTAGDGIWHEAGVRRCRACRGGRPDTCPVCSRPEHTHRAEADGLAADFRLVCLCEGGHALPDGVGFVTGSAAYRRALAGG